MRHFVVCGACFTVLHLGLSTACSVPFHLLCGDHHEGQALPTGKTAPVVANYDVIDENDVIQGHMCTDGAAINVVPYPTFASSGVWIVIRKRIKHECNSWSRHTGETDSPSKTMTVSSHPTLLAISTMPWTMRARSADLGPVITFDFLGLV